jgi:anaerobic selenocysteine-containing dehydrogenase
MMGSEGPVGYDLENADFILSFGAGLIEGWGSPGRMIHAWGIWHDAPLKGKIKIVQIEPRASNTASKADQWVAPRPGTEAILALGMAHVIIKEKLYDTQFVQNHTFGFEDWASADGQDHQGFKSLVLEKYSPAETARITGLEEQEIISLATAFARAMAPVAVCGKGKGNLNGSLLEQMAVQALNALTGNINKSGGVLVLDPLPLQPWPEAELDEVAQTGHQKARLDQAGTGKYPFSRSLINHFTEAILQGRDSPVDTLLVFSGNPAYTLPDGGSFNSALKKIPYIVSFTPYQDETAYMADLILPDHTYLEKMDDTVCPPGLQYPLYTLSQPVVDPLYNTRHSGDVIIQVAKALGGTVSSAFPWKDFEASLKARTQGLFDFQEGGLTSYNQSQPIWKETSGSEVDKKDNTSFDKMWRKIKSSGFWYRPPRHEGQRLPFQTPTGKFEFFSSEMELAVKRLAEEIGGSLGSVLKEMGIGAKGDEAFMPHYETPDDGVDTKTYPLRMMPYELINLSSGWAPSPPYLKKTLFDDQLKKDESFAEINSETAVEYGLTQGDRIIVESPKGELRVRVNLFEGAMPGIVFLPLGFGHTAYDAYQRDQGVNPNQIIDSGKDPLSGHAVWWETRVRIKKV